MVSSSIIRETREPPTSGSKMVAISSKSIYSFLFLAFLLINYSALLQLASGAANNAREQYKSSPLVAGSHQHALNYLLFSSLSRPTQDAKLEELLKDSNHSHVSDTVNLQLANSVWKKMRQNALEFAQQRADETKPAINRLLEQSNVSFACQQSINDAIDQLAKLDEWAVKSKYFRSIDFFFVIHKKSIEISNPS